MYLLGCVADKKSIRITHIVYSPNLIHQFISRAAIRLAAFNDLVAQPPAFCTRIRAAVFNDLNLDHQIKQPVKITFLYRRHYSLFPLNSQALANHPTDTPKSTQFKKEPRQLFAYLLSRSCLSVRSVNFFSFSFRSVMGLAFCTDIFFTAAEFGLFANTPSHYMV